MRCPRCKATMDEVVRIAPVVHQSGLGPLLGLPPSFARSVYEETKAAYPDVYRTISFEQWIGFLTGSELCSLGPNGNYVLTVYGRGFLKYLLDRGYANKPL